ncbi:MAG: hypothetical protein EA363_06565 [Balneolaceae bacterium]|nr:MAG: hypothetical protein EA363_06565 [Balneolaceae bacterium]
MIINKPAGEEPMPALLLIPGYTCASIEHLRETHPYRRLIDAYVDAGYVTLRIEKSGLGDSWNTPECASTDLHDEIESFEQGLKTLRSLPYVDPSRIIIYGHSMGGVVAPAISARHDIAGVIAYGTVALSWFEYMLGLVQFGESDFQAYSLSAHEQIVKTVNHYHPGNATLAVFPLTDHYLAKSGTMQEAYDKLIGGQVLQLFDEYNPEVGNSAVTWSNRVVVME